MSQAHGKAQISEGSCSEQVRTDGEGMLPASVRRLVRLRAVRGHMWQQQRAWQGWRSQWGGRGTGVQRTEVGGFREGLKHVLPYMKDLVLDSEGNRIHPSFLAHWSFVSSGFEKSILPWKC